MQAVGSGLCGQRLRARDESALEVAPPDRRLDRRPYTAFTTMRYTNRQPLPFFPSLAYSVNLAGRNHSLAESESVYRVARPPSNLLTGVTGQSFMMCDL